MQEFNEVLRYLSTKTWNLKKDWKKVFDELNEKRKNEELDPEEIKSVKRYIKNFKEPLTFKHDLETYKTGRIFADYVLLPNKPIHNIYLKKLIIPEKDYVFVSFDFKSSQFRHIAEYLNIKWLKKDFEKGVDIYEKFSKLTGLNDRDRAKIIMMILTFGGGKKTLERKYVLDLEDETIEKINEVYNEWFHAEEKTYKEKVELNHIIQRKEADFFKRKMITLYKKQNKKYRLHAFIHDDIICEVHKDHLDHIEKIKKFLEKYKPVKMELEVRISDTFQFK